MARKKKDRSTVPVHDPQSSARKTKKALPKSLTAWLKKQASKLKALEVKDKALGVKHKALEAKVMRLKIDFVTIGRAKGRILAAVNKRLENTSLSFKEWVEKNTDIGYSTALLWIDFDKNFDNVKDSFINSNLLESPSVRLVRDSLRDWRQAQGKGKPGSGKPKAANSPKNSLSWILRERWRLIKDDPDFEPPQQSEEDFTEAHWCFQEAKNPGSTYATVAEATGKAEEEVKRLLRGLDIDREDAEWGEVRGQAEESLGAAEGQTANSQQAKREACVPQSLQVPHSHHDPAQKPHETQPGEVTHFHHGCKDIQIVNERTLSYANQHGERIFAVFEKKGIDRQLGKAITSYTRERSE